MNSSNDADPLSKKGTKVVEGHESLGSNTATHLKTVSGRRPIVIDIGKKEDEGDGGGETGGGGTSRGDLPSYLVAETAQMARNQRISEQEGLRQLGVRVIAREHNLDEPKQSPEGELQNSIQQHPLLNSQRFDGIDPNLNPEPPLNTEARREFDNEKREQEMEKQLRLGNMPKFNSAPKPQGG